MADFLGHGFRDPLQPCLPLNLLCNTSIYLFCLKKLIPNEFELDKKTIICDYSLFLSFANYIEQFFFLLRACRFAMNNNL